MVNSKLWFLRIILTASLISVFEVSSKAMGVLYEDSVWGVLFGVVWFSVVSVLSLGVVVASVVSDVVSVTRGVP